MWDSLTVRNSYKGDWHVSGVRFCHGGDLTEWGRAAINQDCSEIKINDSKIFCRHHDIRAESDCV